MGLFLSWGEDGQPPPQARTPRSVVHTEGALGRPEDLTPDGDGGCIPTQLGRAMGEGKSLLGLRRSHSHAPSWGYDVILQA